MKKITFIPFLIFVCFTFGQVSISPYPFTVDQNITITIDENSSATNCNHFNNPSKVYIHSGIGNDSEPWGFSVIGNWGQDDGVGKMTDNGDGSWSISFVPETYYGLSVSQAQNATKMGMVFRNESGSQEFKANNCQNFYFDVGVFQVSMSSPEENSISILNLGENLNISASNMGGGANYELSSNGNMLHTQNSTTNFSYTHSNIQENQNYILTVNSGETTITKRFSVLIDPGEIYADMPTDYPEGLSYLNDTEAVLVLDAPGKDFVYLAGSFNNWQPNGNYAMLIDPSRDNKFWLKISGLTAGQIETYQYWVADNNPVANSPTVVKTADPFSTLVLSPFDDPYIPSTTYPDLPIYPEGQEREVSVLQTGQIPYNWQVSTFEKPKKEDLMIYEVLIRDFDANRNFQDLIDRIDYFKDLNINAIELMPVMEFEGNESWGYNTAFHMALDKFYGTKAKLKELIDTCHKNGIAVILDIALNHAYGRNPLVRMWMNDPDGDGWGDPSTENPYFNTSAAHSYSVGSDFDHSNAKTKNYVKRVVKYWIEEFRIDGFRWDLTKGFTQNCTNNEGCTNDYNADRVAILKEYADYSWSLDPDHYVIFEHLGTNWDANNDGKDSLDEETEWANYRANEGKGIMLWGKITEPYNQLTMGYSSNSNINSMGHISRDFDKPRLVGYAESHDEERLMYKNVQYGNSSGGYNIKNLDTALDRMPALGAVSLSIPGPKMIWHFGELGMDNSINTCSNGSVGDCKLDTKPQPQWAENWLANPDRAKIYEAWARLIDLKVKEPVFEGSYSINSGTLTPRIYIWNDDLKSDELNSIVILANFDVTTKSITPNFPHTGIWYDLMDESNSTSLSISNVSSPISLDPGAFKVYGNQMPAMGTKSFDFESSIKIYPNPVVDSFKLDTEAESLSIYNLQGQEVIRYSRGLKKGESYPVDSLEKGIYLVYVRSENGKRQHFKLVKKCCLKH